MCVCCLFFFFFSHYEKRTNAQQNMVQIYCLCTSAKYSTLFFFEMMCPYSVLVVCIFVIEQRRTKHTENLSPFPCSSLSLSFSCLLNVYRQMQNNRKCRFPLIIIITIIMIGITTFSIIPRCDAEVNLKLLFLLAHRSMSGPRALTNVQLYQLNINQLTILSSSVLVCTLFIV